jgi:hypothetical protein
MNGTALLSSSLNKLREYKFTYIKKASQFGTLFLLYVAKQVISLIEQRRVDKPIEKNIRLYDTLGMPRN